MTKTSEAIREDMISGKWKFGRTTDFEAAMRVANENAKVAKTITVIYEDDRGYGVLFHHEFYAIPAMDRPRWVTEKRPNG